MFETVIAILKVEMRENDTVRAWCLDTETGDRVTVYAKGAVGKQLAASVRRKVGVRYKVLDTGWYVTKITGEVDS